MKKSWFVTVLLVFLFSFSVFSQDKDKSLEYIESSDDDKDVMSLGEIDDLIKATDYNKALYELHKYIEKYPERFDHAQNRIKTIMQRRSRYSVLTERAIKSSEENPEDHETPSKIILEMKTLEKNPPADVQKVIDLLEEMHLFKYYAYLFDTIQEDSAKLTRANDTLGAIAKVQEGFWVYHDEFLEDWKGNHSVISDADKILADLNAYIREFSNADYRKQATNLVQAFIKNVNDDKYIQAYENYEQLSTVMKKYADLRNNIYNCSVRFRQLYEKQKRLRPEITDASYLPFMQRFVSGVAGIPDSGIVGAMDYEFGARIESMKNAVARIIEKHTNSFMAVLPQKIIAPKTDLTGLKNASSYTTPVSNFAVLGRRVNGWYGLIQSPSGKADSKYLEFNECLSYVADLSLKVQKLYPIADALNKENENQIAIRDSLKNNKNNPDYNSSLYIRKLFDSVSEMYKITGSRNDLYPSDSAYVTCENQKLDWKNLKNRYADYVNELFAKSEDAVVSSWNEISQSFIDDASSYEKQMKEYIQYASVFSTGFADKLDEETYRKLNNNPKALLEYAKTHPSVKEGQTAYKYPKFCIQMIQSMENIASGYENTMNSAQKEFEYNLETHPEWKQNKRITDVVSKSASYMERKTQELSATKQSVSQMTTRAQGDADSAAKKKAEADSLFEQSRTSYNRGELEKAEKYLVQSNEKYAEVLAIEDNPVLRREVDEKQLALSRQITDARNEIVVRESRELYTRARNAQTEDRYDDAELLINSAINKWAETHEEKNDEFESFRELVNTAVSMKTGRILLVSDPLYAEMSQLLSIAYQYYDSGRKLYTNGQNEEGDAQFELAMENLNKIKKVYPINQEASLLVLKIDQIRDPKKFQQEFGEKIKQAVAKCKVPETQTEGYNSLINYYSLEPNYKGLKKTIDDIEIELGMKAKPVDNSTAARSRRLTEDAQTQYNRAGNDHNRLTKALQTVNEALRLNPNNNDAIRLKDRIATKLGGTTTIVLSSEDQALLARAKNEYQAGRIDEANILMIQILNNNPQNIKVKSVSDLKKKIDARL